MKNIFQKTILGLALVTLAAACNTQAPAVQTNPSMPEMGMNGMQTYTNSSYHFSFMYGKDFSFVTPTYGNLSNQIVQVQMDNSAYPKTNFGDADVTVSEAYAKTQAACLQFPSTAADATPFVNTQSINGVTFYTAKGSDAGAGNDYVSMIYRTYRDTDCIELTETIHTTAIGNYPAGSVTAVDTAPIQSELDMVVHSFSFTH